MLPPFLASPDYAWALLLRYTVPAIVLVTLVKWMNKRRRNPRSLPYPPGPRGYPVIGSLLQIPSEKPWLVYNEWSKTYGDMIFYSALGTNFLILESLEKTNDLFNERSTNYSDRVRMPMLNELMDWKFNFGLMPYGTWWRRHRKMFHDHFSPSVIGKYDDVQMRNVHAFLGRLLDKPEGFFHHIHHVFAAVIMDIVYGVKIQDSNDDPYVATIHDALADIAIAGVPGSFLVDFFPILKNVPSWFPGASFQKVAARGREVIHRLAVKPFNEVKEAMASGTARPSIVMSIINDLPNDSSRVEEETIAQDVAAVSYVAGADTTASAVQAFFLAMVMYPEAQKKAQAELDAVIGCDRLPEFGDLPSLPYLDALMKEVLRWHQVIPFAVAHMSSEDDEYNGYFIPKGTIVMGNAWSILNDPKVFEAPSEFNPDRYIKNPDLRSPHEATFGYGRRICPGRYFGDRNLFAITSSVLAVFDILPPVDNSGKPTKVGYEPTTGFISYPSPFSCRIMPRSLIAKQLILEAQTQI